MLLACCGALAFTACQGVLSDIYDTPDTAPVTVARGQLYIDASSWDNWYYISLDSLQMLAESNDSTRLDSAQAHFTAWPIPTTETDGTDSCGIYTYWFDIFGKGLSVNHYVSSKHTAPQPEPGEWDLAIHRDNVRTNGGAALETSCNSMDELPPTSASFADSTFTPDTWTENQVWIDRTQMLQNLMGSQGISINPVLSGWLTVNIPPIPPTFTLNSHVFIVRTRSGKYAAVQLHNYLSPTGTTCCLTINYRYPY